MQSFRDIEAWAEAYIRVQDAEETLNQQHPDYLAAYEFMENLKGARAEECWSGILAVVRRKPSEKVLGMVAAGLMEDLLEGAGAEFIDRIEVESRRNPTFRAMLGGVWKSGPADVWARLEAARK